MWNKKIQIRMKVVVMTEIFFMYLDRLHSFYTQFHWTCQCLPIVKSPNVLQSESEAWFCYCFVYWSSKIMFRFSWTLG